MKDINDVQELQLELIKRASFNLFDGKKVVEDLEQVGSQGYNVENTLLEEVRSIRVEPDSNIGVLEVQTIHCFQHKKR